ncbi:sigma-70 family RNA polymerase sigma factor [Heliobacterium undosum]|uniref:Sigma-70 family RNA polymerase sigma factor n=1 Tax=Heliomicrobium undosum TaxID=121734 RepID=A0A845L290_9FIRM|nr:sigma-70 family RNA polymerase sigma factor [Heliomicrobium undosum]MZP29776.1 sigma-70 family RNA polymerase sigma factor [Heliomicrobium undosum]
MDVDGKPIRSLDHYTFGTIYTHYYPKIYKYILRRIGNPDIANDLAGQTFEQAFIKKITYHPEKGTVSSWLYAIAHNIVVDYKRSARNTVSLDALSIVPSSTDKTPEIITLSNETTAQLNRALSKLSERERKVVTLKYVSGLANRKIARMMNLSDQNVGVILFRTLRKLRRIMEKSD